jgi:uncharacterized protein
MSVSWSELGAAIALYLVLEGVFPFLNPQGFKRRLLTLTQMENRYVRLFGFASMLSGLALLHYFHS